MFKKIYTGFAVAILTGLVSWISWIGLTQRVQVWMLQTNWQLVGLAITGAIFLAIIVDLCYNYFVAHRETMSAAIDGFIYDLGVAGNVALDLFNPRKWLKQTSIVLLTILIGICLITGSIIVSNQLLIAFDKATNFDLKVKEVEASYKGRVDQLLNETEVLRRDVWVYQGELKEVKQQVEVLLDKKVTAINKTKLKFSTGDSKNSQGRPYLQ